MSRRNSRIVSPVLLALAAIAGVAIVTGLSLAAAQPPNQDHGAAVSTSSCADAPEGTPDGNSGATPSSPNDDAAGTAAACRRAPECSVDSDCDAICGAGLGHCVHSSCPVRICKCK